MKVLIDKHVPTVRLTKRQIQSKLKPWITPGIITSISKRDFLHRKFINAKNVDDKARYLALFKTYRNQIVTLCRQSKSAYYTRYFTRHSQNLKKVWSGVRDIISSKADSNSPISISTGDTVTTNQDTIADCFNDFFTSIADNIRNEIPQPHQNFRNFLKHQNPNSIFISQVTPEEVIKVIGSFSTSKSSGPNSIPIRILKLLKQDISIPISMLINQSFQKGVFPSVLKISRVTPVFLSGVQVLSLK